MIERLTDTIARNTVHADRLAGAVEALALALVTRLAAWVACIPTILLTARSIETIFVVTPRAALLSSIALEVVGQSVVNTWLSAREWNATKRKSDPQANSRLALGATVVYFATDFLLIGVLEIPKALSNPIHYAALLFPLAQVVSTLMTAERAAQFLREADVAQEQHERAQRRAQKRAQERAQQVPNTVAQLHNATAQGPHKNNGENAQMGAQNDVLSAINQDRETQKQAAMDALLGQFAQDPYMPITEAAERVGVHRNTVYNYLSELEEMGKVKRNGGGVEVLL